MHHCDLWKLVLQKKDNTISIIYLHQPATTLQQNR